MTAVLALALVPLWLTSAAGFWWFALPQLAVTR